MINENNLKLINKQIEFAFAQAFFSYLYTNKLITTSELSAIRLEVQKGNVFLDNNTQKSDVYV